MSVEIEATAADSGARATERFRSDKSSGTDVSSERIDRLASRAINALVETIREENVTYEEYNALKSWLIQVGETGEWPLFLDVWLEHAVEEVANDHRAGSKGTIEGPYYVPGSPVLESPATLPMRDGEQGIPFVFRGRVTSVDGDALPGASVEIWHADDLGFYSQFAPNIPEWNLRGTVRADAEGFYEIRTVQPAPYQIPTDGACGQLISAAGWHAWRPAHLHIKIVAEGHQLITTQLYFTDDQHLGDDIASAVKPELVLDPQDKADGIGREVVYDFVLDTAK